MKLRLVYSIIGLTFLSFVANSQQCFNLPDSIFKPNPNLIDNGNITICNGSSINISVTGLGEKYCSNLNLVNGRATVKPTKKTSYTVSTIIPSGNLIPNSDFSFGDTLFSSDYTLYLANVWKPGKRVIATSPKLLHPSFSDCHDHTTGTGNMLLANGAEGHEKIWQVKIPVKTNQVYDFSYWAQSVILSLPSEDITKLQVFINGKPVGDLAEVSRTPCDWKEFTLKWNSGNNTIADISIVDMNIADASNDFALDDMSFSTTYYYKDELVVDVTSVPRTVYDTTRSCNVDVPRTYIDTLRDGFCDTLFKFHTIEVNTVLPITTVCIYNGCESTVVKGKVYYRDTTIVDTLKSFQGCDSLFQVDKIYVGRLTAKIISDTLRSCGFITDNGIQYLEPTTLYLDTIKTVSGQCDSIIYTKQIQPSTPAQLITKIIYSCTPTDKYSKSTVIYDTIKSIINPNCDSVHNVTEVYIGKDVIRDTVNILSCTKYSSQIDTFRTTTLKCDSLIRVTNYIVGQEVKIDTINTTLCSGESYIMPSGVHVNINGTYKDTIRYSAGCDSLITIANIRIKPLYISKSKFTFCDYAFDGNGDTIRATGIYTDTIRYTSGCDSLIKVVDATLMQAKVINRRIIVECDTTIKPVDIIKSKQGCDSVIQYNTVINRNGDVEIASAFTPNKDGLNDCFGIKLYGEITEFNLKIFNRWGVLMFETSDRTKCWDGTYKGISQNMDTYVYEVSGKTSCGKLFKSGTIILIR